MADTTALKNRIRAAIKANDNQEITGPVLQQTLLDIVDELDLNSELQEAINNEKEARQTADTQLCNLITSIKNNIDNGYVYAGIATPLTAPVSGKVFYLALTAGTYTNFGNITLPLGISTLSWDGTQWTGDTIYQIDTVPTAGSDGLVKSGGVFNGIQNSPQLAYVECDTAAATAAKVVALDGYILPTNGGGSMKIKMVNVNTADNVTLNINDKGAKPLYYNGTRAGSSNSWGAGEVLEVYYDGTNYNTVSSSGGTFKTGQRLTDVGIDATPTKNSTNLVQSGGVNAITEQLEGVPSTFHEFTLSMTDGKYIGSNGTIYNISGRAVSDLVDISEYAECDIYVMFAGSFSDSLGYALYKADGTFIFGKRQDDISSWTKMEITSDTKYVRVSSKSADINDIALYAMRDAKDSYQSLKAKVEKHDIVISSMDLGASTTIYGDDDSHNFKDTGASIQGDFFVKLPAGIYTKLKFYVNANATIPVNFYAYNEDVGRVLLVYRETLTNSTGERAIVEKDVFLDFTNKERLCIDISNGIKYSGSTAQYPGIPFYRGDLISLYTAADWDACTAYGGDTDFSFSLEYLVGAGYEDDSIIRTVKTSAFFKKKKYVAYGDSIMVVAGGNLSSPYIIPLLIGRYFDMVTVNRGASGSVPIASSNLSDANLAYVDEDTMLVTISGGQNNWVTAEDINSTDRATSIGAINYYIDQIRSISPKCVIVLCPTYIGNGNSQCAIDYARIAENKHVGLAPTLNLNLIDWEYDKTPKVLRYDNVHPTEYGCIRFAAVCTHYMENYIL